MTIEERAYNYYPKEGIVEGTGRYAYIQGATEQKKIDIDKVCEWLMNNFYYEETMVECIAYNGTCDDKFVMINDFRKAMEE